MDVKNKMCLVALMAMTACHPMRQSLTLIPLNNETEESSQPSTSELLPPSTAELVYDNSPELNAALKEFATSGKAPIVKHAGFVLFPFGEVQPVLNCQTDYGCDIELQPGEQVKAVILGNEPLWDYLVWESNQQQEAVQHVTIGPRVSQARTNAIIGTDRRTYHLELLSTNKSDYTRSAKFYYPRERLRQFQAKQKGQRKQSSELAKADPNSALPYQYVSFGWNISGDSNVPWKPVRVFDDRAHIYLYFPEEIRFESFPGIYTPVAGGQLSEPIWRTVKADTGKSRDKGTYIVVDGMFDELRLVGEVRGEQQTVVIRKEQ